MSSYVRYNYRLKPTESQAEMLHKHIGATRFIYNKLLEVQIKYYEEEKKFHFGFSLASLTKDIRKDNDWLKEVNSQTLQQSAMNLGTSFKNRFKHKSGFPKFKSGRKSRQSFVVPQHFTIEKDRIKLPKIGWIKYINSRQLIGKAKSLTIIRDIDDWFVSILLEIPEKEAPDPIDYNNAVGIDIGIKTFAFTSDGECLEMPKFEEEYRKLKKLQRRLSKKQKGSSNRNKTRKKVAKQCRKITRKRNEIIHNYVVTITKSYDVISMENLNISGMKKNRKLSGSIQNLPWFFFKSKIKEKAKVFYEVDRWFPSSKTCSGCGWVHKELKLSDRTFNCSCCKLSIDRDLNAAINIKTVATAGLACGESSSGELVNETNSSYDSVKQESGIRWNPNNPLSLKTCGLS